MVSGYYSNGSIRDSLLRVLHLLGHITIGGIDEVSINNGFSLGAEGQLSLLFFLFYRLILILLTSMAESFVFCKIFKVVISYILINLTHKYHWVVFNIRHYIIVISVWTLQRQ